MLWTGSLQSRHMQEKKSNFFATFFNAATLHSMVQRWRYTSLEYTSEMCHAIISGIITKKAPVIYWPVFFSPSLVTVIRPRHFHQSPNIAFTFKFSNLYVSVSFFFFFQPLKKVCLTTQNIGKTDLLKCIFLFYYLVYLVIALLSGSICLFIFYLSNSPRSQKVNLIQFASRS